MEYYCFNFDGNPPLSTNPSLAKYPSLIVRMASFPSFSNLERSAPSNAHCRQISTDTPENTQVVKVRQNPVISRLIEYDFIIGAIDCNPFLNRS